MFPWQNAEFSWMIKIYTKLVFASLFWLVVCTFVVHWTFKPTSEVNEETILMLTAVVFVCTVDTVLLFVAQPRVRDTHVAGTTREVVGWTGSVHCNTTSTLHTTDTKIQHACMYARTHCSTGALYCCTWTW